MHVNSYLRMVLMFGENKAQTLYKNLERMIALVLYESEKENRSILAYTLPKTAQSNGFL